jgi:hypothetical protein
MERPPKRAVSISRFVGVFGLLREISFEDAGYGLTAQAKYQTTPAIAKFAIFNHL